MKRRLNHKNMKTKKQLVQEGWLIYTTDGGAVKGIPPIGSSLPNVLAPNLLSLRKRIDRLKK